MAAFLEDPRLRQRWNQISHNAETVTENAAAGIWNFQHDYVGPCLSSVGEALDSCTSVCLGDREDRARRQRERARGAYRTRAEYSFDFYDDWYDDFNEDDGLDQGHSDMEEEQAAGGGASGSGTISSIFGRGFFGSWRGSRSEDWDRLLAGSGSTRNRHHDGDGDGEAGGDGHGEGPSDGAGASGEIVDQPRRGRGMSYSTRAMRRKGPGDNDPTIIPSTAPLGFLSRLPWRIGGTLRYKPSAANLREHPNSGGTSGGSLQNSMAGRRMGGGADMMRTRDENEPLLGAGSDDYDQGGDGTGSRRGLLSWQNELEAADASRQYGTAMSSVPPVGRPTTSGSTRPGTADSMAFDDNSSPRRKRSGTTSSGDTSNSFRSRGDLFPSDEEDDEDAVPLDDEFAVALNHVDDRGSTRTRFSSSSSLAATAAKEQRKGKKRADTSTSSISLASAGPGQGPSASASGPAIKGVLTRSVSRTTIDSVAVGSSPRSPPLSIPKRLSNMSLPLGEAFDERVDEVEGEQDGSEPADQPPAVEMTAEQIREEDERAAREEDEAIAKRREAAARLAKERGLVEVAATENNEVEEADKSVEEPVAETVDDKTPALEAQAQLEPGTPTVDNSAATYPTTPPVYSQKAREAEFVPARLPRFD